jgi:methylated-DNA-[protein]-cysteine S-methyltransferase
MTEYTIETIDTPDGPFTVLEDEDHRVVSSGWTADRERILGRLPALHRPIGITIGRVASADAVRAYYDGDVQHVVQVPVRQYGTELFLRGWQHLRAVPAGEVVTYTGFAAALDRPSAVRAAASICARNAPALFVPCHRVLRTDGTLGGFAWGLDVKRSLLEREAVDQIVAV